jgi:hypothetical protein
VPAAPSGVPGTPDVGGGASISGGAGGVSVDSNVDTSGMRDVTSAPDDMARGVGDAQFASGEMSVEAGVRRAGGTEGAAVMGGGVGVAANEVPGQADIDAGERKLDHVGRVQKLEARDAGNLAVEGAMSDSGYKDPTTELGRAEKLEFNERDRFVGRADVGGDAAADLQRAAANPGGEAQIKAEYEMNQEIREHSPIDPTSASAAASAANDPRAAAESELDAKISEKRGDATVCV